MRVRQTTPALRTRRPALKRALAQHTLGRSVSLDGIGIHRGGPARLTLHPADADTGVVFHRTGLGSGCEAFIAAKASNLVSTQLATRLAARPDAADGVGTVEHVLAALSALGIDNALLEIDGHEVPILDGSAAPIVEAIDEAGVVLQNRPRKTLQILAPVRVSAGAAFAEFRPHTGGLALDIEIEFADPAVGRQRRALTLDEQAFRREIARARTFGFVADAEHLWRTGFALGASFDNTIVVADGRVLNPGGLRFADEFVRHKMLDAVGDLALAGAPIEGAFRSFRGGHALNCAALTALLARPAAWRWVTAGSAPMRRLRDVSASAIRPAR